MRFGALKGGAMFVTAFAGMFAAMSVGAPAARSQAGLLQRMTFMHHNPQQHFSIVDPTLPPTQAASETVGRFISSSAQSSKLVEGHPYPNHLDPDYLYGVTLDGFTIRRVGQTGGPIDTANFGNLFSRVLGAWLVTNNVPVNPQWIPRAYDLKEHFVIVGELNQGNQSLQGNSTGMMMINPKTMTGYNVGNTAMFLGPSSSNMFEDVCFGVYPGPDADYATIDDNEYRYVMFMSQDQTDDQGIFVLSLNKHETMNGTNPPSPWNPVPQERGPSYTNVFPVVTSNNNTDIMPIVAVDNGQMYVRAYYARPEIAATGFDAPTDVTYVVAGFVQLVAVNPNRWGCFVESYTIGTSDPIALMYPQQLVGNNVWFTDDIFKGMSVVGDWLICSTGDGNAGDGFADFFHAVYLPELCDGPGDNGVSVEVSQGPGTVGFAGYHVSNSGHPVITYLGCGAGQSVVSATTRTPFQDYLTGAGLINGPLTNIDMHTEEEKLLGINIRRAPQPFVGFWFSEDPASNFPGFRDGGGNGKSGCGGSATGEAGASVGLLALVGMSFLVVQVLREARRT